MADKKEDILDLSEKGMKDGKQISLDTRLFIKFTAFSNCKDNEMLKDITRTFKRSDVSAVIYQDLNDPSGIGIINWYRNEHIRLGSNSLRKIFQSKSFSQLNHKPEFDMLGRTYSIGYEQDLEETLLARPLRKILDKNNEFGIWYPLRRKKGFYVLPEAKQKKILGEHGSLAKRYGHDNLATDIRLACHGLDKNDNDFVIGLLGSHIHPLSAVVEEMRTTEQTSQYLESLGPFFVGKSIWHYQSQGIDEYRVSLK